MKNGFINRISPLKSIISILVLVFVVLFACMGANKGKDELYTEELKKEIVEGDIIFQISANPQGEAIALATGSQYTHVGYIVKKDGELIVMEAVQPVRYTEISKWIDQGKDDHYVLKRLKNSKEILSDEKLKELKTVGESYLGKDYDIYFAWSDNEIYCSELVWKVYKNVLDLEIGKLRPFRDFNFEDGLVIQMMQERYGDDIPYEEPIISPGDMFDSELLIEVLRGN